LAFEGAYKLGYKFGVNNIVNENLKNFTRRTHLLSSEIWVSLEDMEI